MVFNSFTFLWFFPLVFFLYKIIQKSFRKLHHARWINEANMSSYISDSMSGQRIIKAFAKEKEESSRFAGYSSRSAAARAGSGAFW